MSNQDSPEAELFEKHLTRGTLKHSVAMDIIAGMRYRREYARLTDGEKLEVFLELVGTAPELFIDEDGKDLIQ